MGWVALALVGLAWAEAPEPLRVTADELTWDEGVVEARGQVHLWAPGAEVAAEALHWDTQTFTLEAPTLRIAGFDAEARRLTYEVAEGRLTLEQGSLNPCGGCPPAWTLGAQSLGWDVDAGRGELRRVVMRVGPVPVLWLPWMPLREAPRRVVPGLPIFGRGPDGLQVGLPLTATLSPKAQLTLTPEWRRERGFRASSELRLPGVALDAAGGWDTQDARWRGSVGGQAAGALGRWSAGVEGLLVSDAAYLGHFPDDYLVRSTPWTSTRGHAGWGPLSLEWRGWQDSAAKVQGVPSLVLAHGQRLGPLRLDGVARADLLAQQPRGEAGLSALVQQDLGPVALEALAAGRAWSAGGLGADGRSQLSLGLPMWAAHGAWRHELVPGLAAGLGGAWGEDASWVDVAAITPLDPAGVAWAGVPVSGTPGLGLSPEGWWAGPTISSNWWASRKSVRLDVAGVYTPEGLAGSGSGALRLGALELSAQGAARAGEAVWTPRLRWDGERLELRLAWRGVSGVQEAQQGVGAVALHLPAPRGTWTPGLNVVARPDQLAAGGVSLGWVAAGDCLALGARLGFAEDREGPQASAWLRVTPRRATSTGPS